MIELDRNIGHNSVMSICGLLIDRYEPSHIVDHVIHEMEGIGDTSDEGSNRMGQLFMADFSVYGYSVLLESVYMIFFIDRDVEPPCHTVNR